MKKAIINGSLFTVYSYDEINKAILEEDGNAIEVEGHVFPIAQSKFSNYNTFMYPDGSHYIFIRGNDFENYNIDNIKIIDFSNTSSLKEQIEKNASLREMEASVLTTADRVFKPIIKPTDMPEMAALKEAVNRKNIDLDKYAYRFGDNYNNDRRLFDKSSITLTKMRAVAEALDMDCYITFDDRSAEVPNPIGGPIKVKITNIEEE